MNRRLGIFLVLTVVALGGGFLLRSFLQVGNTEAPSSIIRENRVEAPPEKASRAASAASKTSATIHDPTSWATPYGKEFWRVSSKTEGGLPFHPAEVADRVNHCFRPNGSEYVVEGSGYTASTRGNASVFELPGGSGAKLALSTTGVRAGARTLYSGESATQLDTEVQGNVLQRRLSAASDLVEHTEMRSEGMRVTWVLGKQPTERGDLQIDWKVEGMRFERREGGYLLYTDGSGRPKVRISHVTVVDYAGKRTDLNALPTGKGLEIRVPAELVASASYPLAIDPVIEPVNIAEGISTPAFVSGSADAAWLNDRWLVVWAEIRNGNSDVRGTLVTKAGLVLDPGGFEIATSPTIAEINPRVCAMNDKWFVCWEENLRLFTRFIGSSGARDMGTRTGSTISNFEHLQFAKNTNNEILAVWRSKSSGDILATRITSSGSFSVPPLVRGLGNQRLPQVAALGNSWYVVWEDYRNGASRIYGALIGDRGTVSPQDGVLIGTGTQPCLAGGDTAWLVAWMATDLTFIEASAVNSQGVIQTPSAISCPGKSVSASAFPNGGDRWCIVSQIDTNTIALHRFALGTSFYYETTTWQDVTGLLMSAPSVAPAESQLVVKTHDSTGIRIATTSLSNPYRVTTVVERSINQVTAGKIIAGGDTCLVLSQRKTDNAGAPDDLEGAIAMMPPAEPPSIETPFRFQTALLPQTRQGPNGWLLTWPTLNINRKLKYKAARVSPAGVLQDIGGIGLGQSTLDQTGLSTAPNQDGWFLTWNESQLPGSPEIYIGTIREDQSLDSVEPHRTIDGYGIQNVAEWSNDHWLVALTSITSYRSMAIRLWRVDPDTLQSALLGSFSDGSQQFEPCLSQSGDGTLLLWRAFLSGEIRLRGTIVTEGPGETFDLGYNHARSEGELSLAAGDTGWMTAWTEVEDSGQHLVWIRSIDQSGPATAWVLDFDAVQPKVVPAANRWVVGCTVTKTNISDPDNRLRVAAYICSSDSYMPMEVPVHGWDARSQQLVGITGDPFGATLYWKQKDEAMTRFYANRILLNKADPYYYQLAYPFQIWEGGEAGGIQGSGATSNALLPLRSGTTNTGLSVFAAQPLFTLKLIGEARCGQRVSFTDETGRVVYIQNVIAPEPYDPPPGFDHIYITAPGTYTVRAVIEPEWDDWEPRFGEITFEARKALARVSMESAVHVYNGKPWELSASTNPWSLKISTTYNDSSEAPVGIGVYQVETVVNDPLWEGQATATLEITRGAAQLTFDPIADQVLGTPPIPIYATSSLDSPVKFEVVSGPASVEEYPPQTNPQSLIRTTPGFLKVEGAGEIVVRAVIEETPNYAGAEVVQTISVARKSQTLTFDAVSNAVFQYQPIALKAEASSGLPVEFSVVEGNAGIVSGKLVLNGIGRVIVRAEQPGNSEFGPAFEDQAFEIGKRSQVIRFEPPTILEFTRMPIPLTAFSTAGLPVSLGIAQGPAAITGNQLSLQGLGAVAVAARQGGDAVTTVAVPVTRTLLAVDTTDPVIGSLHRSIGASGRAVLRGAAKDNFNPAKIRYRLWPEGHRPRKWQQKTLPGIASNKSWRITVDDVPEGTSKVEVVLFDSSGNRSHSKTVRISR